MNARTTTKRPRSLEPPPKAGALFDAAFELHNEAMLAARRERGPEAEFLAGIARLLQRDATAMTYAALEGTR